MNIFKKVILSMTLVSLSLPYIAFLQNDLLDDAFQPAKNLEQVINIGNNKNAVGNEIFRGTTDVGVKVGNVRNGEVAVKTTQTAPLLVRITQTLLRLTIGLSIPVLFWIGLKIIKNGMAGGEIKDSIQEVSGVLLGLVLALSAMGIISLIQSITTGGKAPTSSYPDKINEICTGLPENAQRNTTSSITQTWDTISETYVPTTKGTYSTKPITNNCIFQCNNNYSYDAKFNTCVISKRDSQNCTGLPDNAQRNTTSSITQTWDDIQHTFVPATNGTYNNTSSTKTCVFTCKSKYAYNKQSNTCSPTTQTNQACTGLPENAQRNTTSTIVQSWNTTKNIYEPNTIGTYSTTPSSNTCVFWCKPGYSYEGNRCVIRTKSNQSCTGLPQNAQRNTTSTIVQSWNTTKNIYEPNTIGTYSTTPSSNTCIFKCNSNAIYDKQSNTCMITTKTNQACTGLPQNAERNIATGVIQNWNETSRKYIPTTVGTYNTTPSTTTCVFQCKSGYEYITRLCQ